MKESRFNHYTIHKGSKLAFNAISCALAITDETYERLMTQIRDIHSTEDVPNDLKECFNAAKQGKFIVEDDCDELLVLETKRNVDKYDLSKLNLTIAPTLSCNFKCKYCYETPQSGVMTEETQRHLIQFIEQQSNKIKNLHITWYGGEPLLAKEIIFSLSNEIISLCEQKDIRYSATMVSNGYLLNEETIQRLAELEVKTIQITLDGPRDVHNSRRVCKSSTNSFDTIIKNINCLLKDGRIMPSLRINVDKTNSNTIEELLSYLSTNLINHKIKIHLGKVEAHTETCKSIASNCFNNEGFAELVLNYSDQISKYGFDDENRIPYPRIRLNYCSAEILNSFVVDPNGYLYKCWNEVGDVDIAVGNIINGASEIFNTKNALRISHNPIKEEKCKDCKVLSLCMGGCPQTNEYKKTSHTCDQIKYMLQGIMEKYLEANNNY